MWSHTSFWESCCPRGKDLGCWHHCAAGGASLEPNNHPWTACMFLSLEGNHWKRRKQLRVTVNALGKCVIIAAWSCHKQEERSQQSQAEGIFSIHPRFGSDASTTSTLASGCAARCKTAQGKRVSREVPWGIREQTRLMWMKSQPRQQHQALIRRKFKIKPCPHRGHSFVGSVPHNDNLRVSPVCWKGSWPCYLNELPIKTDFKNSNLVPREPVTEVAAHNYWHYSMLSA